MENENTPASDVAGDSRADYSDRGLEMLSAAHVLLSSDRVTDEHDLLVSTCLETLESGPSDIDSLAHECNEIWPAAEISREAVRAAMSEAEELDLVVRTSNLIGESWTLGTQGRSEINATREWFGNAMDRLARQIQDRARDDFGEITFELAHNWAQVILRLFSAEIARSAAVFGGEVERGAAGTIRPMVLDGGSMMASLDRLQLQAGTIDFLKGCLIAAVDETDPFANELIGQVATSCVLHAIAARRGRAGAQNVLGTLASKRLVLDTPILVSLLGTDTAERRLKELIRQAVALQMEVIVPEHTLDELNDVVERLTKDHLPVLTAALKSGIKPRTYAQIVNEQILELFLDAVAAGVYKNWNDLVVRVNGLHSELGDMGVSVRPHNNKNRSNVAWLAQTLTESLAHANSGRSEKAIARDAESIEMVWRARRRNHGKKGGRQSLWPGGWMISYDRQAGPAYCRVNNLDREPLVLTPAQLATLMADSAPAIEIPDLVATAASYLRQESMLRIATKYPPAVALTMARSLSGEYISETDARVAQLSSLGEMLAQASSGERASGERIASELASRRTNRLAAAAREQVDLASLERSRLDEALVRNSAVVDHEQSARIEAEERVRELEASAALTNRKIATGVIITALLAAAIILCAMQLWGFALGTVISTAVFAALSRGWTRNANEGIGRLFLALVPEVAGLYDIATRLLQ